jgi:AcrR family transcriptional regulator
VADLLGAEGPTALTVRAVAARAGVSVQAVYTLFGGKPALCEALFDEGFAALQAALDAVAPALTPSEAPAEVVVRQVLTYRATALAAPGTYAMMFGRPVPEFQPSPEALARARGSFLSLVTVLQRALPEGSDPTPEQAALIVWALNHGLVSLELDGVIPGDGGRQLERAVRDLLRSWTTPPVKASEVSVR